MPLIVVKKCQLSFVVSPAETDCSEPGDAVCRATDKGEGQAVVAHLGLFEMSPVRNQTKPTAKCSKATTYLLIQTNENKPWL